MGGYKESPDDSASPWFKQFARFLLPVCSMDNGAYSIYKPRLFGELFSILKYSDDEEQFAEAVTILLDPEHCPCGYCQGSEDGFEGMEIVKDYAYGSEDEENYCFDCTDVCEGCDGCGVEIDEEVYEDDPPVLPPGVSEHIVLDPSEYAIGRPPEWQTSSRGRISLRTLAK